MTESFVQGVNKTNPTPKHQSIGKNGSFWLPKDSSEFASAKNVQKGQGKNPKLSSGKGNVGMHRNQMDAKTDLQAKSSFEKTILSVEKKNVSNNFNTTGYRFVSKNLKVAKSVQFKPNLNPSTQSGKLNKTTIVVAKQVVPVASKEVSKPVIPQQLNNRTIHRDGGKEEQGRKKNNRGTNNASKVSSMEENKKISQNLVAAEPSVLVSESSYASKFVSLIGKSIGPRVAYTNKFAKKVVRFAIDLPNGGKLGVRLEKSDKGISLCFIAPQNEIQSLLNTCRNSIESQVNSESDSELSFHIFSDYQEMDNFFRKVA